LLVFGSLFCDFQEAGTLTITFDNSFSMMTSKTLLYRVDNTPTEPVKTMQDATDDGDAVAFTSTGDTTSA
jgi:hypothetical protein